MLYLILNLSNNNRQDTDIYIHVHILQDVKDVRKHNQLVDAISALGGKKRSVLVTVTLKQVRILDHSHADATGRFCSRP